MSVVFSHLNYVYSSNSPFEFSALNDLSLEIEDHSFSCIIGHTGSGKSTLVQHINALLRPTSGEVKVNDFLVLSKKDTKKFLKQNKSDKENAKRRVNIKELRKTVGLVFQFPEYQLFEETVLKDVSFGPRNFGYSEEESVIKAKEALKLVGLDEKYYSSSPFELSGGQKRRVAIAGIITLKPDILILDEPTAGLDPQGSLEMMELFNKIYLNGTTIIMVTHDMDNVIKYGTNVITLVDGKVKKVCKPYQLFLDENMINELSIEMPKCISFAKKLNEKGFNIDLAKVKDTNSLASLIKGELTK